MPFPRMCGGDKSADEDCEPDELSLSSTSLPQAVIEQARSEIQRAVVRIFFNLYILHKSDLIKSIYIIIASNDYTLSYYIS